MNFKRLLHTYEGKILVSIFVGLGMATLFRKVCKDKNCIEFKGPILKDFEDKVYKHNGKCYKYSVESTSCVANKKTVPIGKSIQEESSNAF